MQKKIINDFSLTIATKNGSGSQTANVILLRTLFKMGIPVTGKNLFPSNIQGQPTWYTIRLSKDGFFSRRENIEIVVSLNSDSITRDVNSVAPGGAFYYADDIPLPVIRKDITNYAIPVKSITQEAGAPPKLRDYLANMVYLGVLALSLGLDLDAIKEALEFQFKENVKAIDLNLNVIVSASNWARENLLKKDPYYVEKMRSNSDMILADGNTAAALGSIFGGVQFAAWYPITPASTLAETLNTYLPQLRNIDGRATYAVIQAEDELAAIGMAVGAGFAGLRSMTSTSGPGLSLMAEYAGLAYYAEIPVVIWDVQRVGPSTGLPTRTAQGDLTATFFLSHGDKQHIILLPGSVNECFEFGWKSFDLAEQLQTPVFVLSDLDLGMNQWMTKPFSYPESAINRGKVLWEDDLIKLRGKWARYQDVDGDGIPYRTIPGNLYQTAAWFGRGTGHDENARYTEDTVSWEANMSRLKRKLETAKTMLPKPIIKKNPNARIGIITYGSSTPAVDEAQFILKKNSGLATSTLRIRALPCSLELEKFILQHERIYIVESNRDGQMKQIISMAIPEYASRYQSICHSDGLPLTTDWVMDAIVKQESINDSSRK